MKQCEAASDNVWSGGGGWWGKVQREELSQGQQWRIMCGVKYRAIVCVGVI